MAGLKTGPAIIINAPQQANVGSSVQLSWTLAGDVTYLWDFGDGTTSTQSSPAHVWIKPGSYTIKLTLASALGSLTATSVITIVGPLSITWLPQMMGVAGQQVVFPAPSGGVLPYTSTVNYGDGQSGSSSNHVYSSPGSYQAKVIVIDDIGATVSTSTQVTIVASAKQDQTIAVTTPGGAMQVGETRTLTATASSGQAVSAVVDGSSTSGYGISGNLLVADAPPGNLFINYNQPGDPYYNPAPQVQQTIQVISSTPPPVSGLLHKANLTYLGAFRVPVSQSGGEWMTDGGWALAYNQANNSLFVCGRNQFVCELSIPVIVNSSNLASLNTASFIQPLTNLLAKLPTNPYGANRIGGLLPWSGAGGQLIGTAYVYYDGGGTMTTSHFRLGSLSLSSSVTGLFSLSGALAGDIAGYMCPMPSDWASKFKRTALTGLCNVPIISRTSSGPAAFGFDPSSLGIGPITVDPYCFYDLNHNLGIGLGNVDPLQNLTTQILGIAFVPGTSTVLFVGSSGVGFIGYGEDSGAWGDPGSPKGGHSMNGEYRMQVWAYDANDFMKAKNGQAQPYQIVPYDVWTFTLPFPGRVAGASLDPAKMILYVSEFGADNVQKFSNLPVIHAFKVSTQAISESVRIGSLIGYPKVSPSGTSQDYPQFYGTYAGAVNKGDPVMLVAGNVYDPAGGSVSQVQFFVDGVKVGAGSHDLSVPHGEHNWQLLIQTSSLSSGAHQVTATSTTTAGVTSQATTWNLVIK